MTGLDDLNQKIQLIPTIFIFMNSLNFLLSLIEHEIFV